MRNVVVRPEVQLSACPSDGGHLFRQYAVMPPTWVCGQCGLVTAGDLQEAQVREAA